MVGGGGHVGEGAGGGQRVLTLSTGRAGARQRIVHMSTACGPGAVVLWVGGGCVAQPAGSGGRRFLRKLDDLSLSFEEVGPLG